MKRTLWAVVLGVLLAGCSADDGGEATERRTESSPTGRQNALAEVRWTLEAELIGQPEFAGGAVVAVRRVAGEQLEIFGVGAESGKELWAHPLSPGGVAPGFEVGFEVVEVGEQHQVGFFAPGRHAEGISMGELRTPVVVVDAESGEELYRSPAVWAAEHLHDCGDDPGFCVLAHETTGTRTWQVDAARRTMSVAPKGIPDDTRSIGTDGLYSTHARPGERIGRGLQGKSVWERPIAEVFGPAVSTDGGFEFVFVGDEDTFVGLVGAAADAPGRTPDSLDLAARAGGALDAATGETLWAGPGLDPGCGPADADDLVGGGPVRCRVTGTVRFGDGEPTFEDLVVTVEGHDLRTGETRWSHVVVGETAEALAWQGATVLSSGGEIMVVDTAEGRRMLQTLTGELTEIDEGDRFLCAEPVTFRYDFGSAVYDRGRDRRGGSLHTPCTGDLEPVDGSPTVSALRDGALWASESTYVMGTKDGLVGYHAP